eukprot:854142-Pelagomonas_calceolata.AAC.1
MVYMCSISVLLEMKSLQAAMHEHLELQSYRQAQAESVTLLECSRVPFKRVVPMVWGTGKACT